MSEGTGGVRGGPVTIGGFAGFGLGVFWYAWGKVGLWKASLRRETSSRPPPSQALSKTA